MILFLIYALTFVLFMGTTGSAFERNELAAGMTCFGIAIVFLVLMISKALGRYHR